MPDGRRELAVVNAVARTLNASVDLPTILSRALGKVAELLELQTGWVLLFDEKSGEPYLAAAQNLPPGLSEEPERMTGWCFCLESFCRGTFPKSGNVGLVRCSRLRKLHLAQGNTSGLRFHASVPLRVSGDAAAPGASRPPGEVKRLGILNVASSEWRELSESELDLLHTIGDMLGVAVERARLHARRLHAVQLEERNRLAREIHDTIAQDLSAIAFQMEAAEAILEADVEPERVRDAIASARALAHKGLEEARRSVLDLRAAPLEGRSLTSALAALVDEMNEEGASNVTFDSPAEPRALPPAIEAGLYRIAQEALRNAARHASAGAVQVRLGGTSTLVSLRVEDDGHGFDADGESESRSGGGFGLVGMRERARLLGGRLHVESTRGVGTRVTAEVPLDRPGN